MVEVCLGVGLVGVILLIAGLVDPHRVTPEWARGSRVFVLAAYAPLACAGGVPFAVSFGAEDPWPRREAAFGQIRAVLAQEDYAAAVALADSCLALSHVPEASGDADSLRALRARAEEQLLYARARAIPGSDAAANRDAYAELARRYPRNALYREKAAHYTRQAARPPQRRRQTASTLRQGSRSWSARGRGANRPATCCRKCTAGVPCGNGCISRGKTCTKPSGCAC